MLLYFCFVVLLTNFKLSNFVNTGAISQIFPLLWNIVSICELNSLKVLAVTSDCASPNHNLLHMHFLMTKEDDIKPDTDVTIWTVNLFRSKFFFHPHIRGGCRGLPLLPMQHPEMDDINFQS